MRMRVISAVAVCVLFCSVVSAGAVREEHQKAFFGEDIHFVVPPGNVGEVVFKPQAHESPEEFIMKEGKVVNSQAYINSLGHLVLEDVQEKNEGLYVVRNANTSQVLKRLILIVRGKQAPAATFNWSAVFRRLLLHVHPGRASLNVST